MNNEFEVKSVATIIKDAAEQVFSMMLDLPIEAGTPFSDSGHSESFDGVIAVIGLAGSWVGSGRISCSAEFACRVSSALLASQYEAVNEEVLDAMAELTNMIIGNVKSALEDHLGPMGLSVPTVIFGRNYRARSSGVSEWIVCPFESGGQHMEVRFCLVPGSQTAPVRAEAELQSAF